MIRYFSACTLLASFVAATGTVAVAQTPAAGTTARPIPVQVQVVISRYRNDKKISSLPYALSARVGQGAARLQVGGNVPVPSGDGKGVTYRNIGTLITVVARALEDGRYEIDVNVSETAVAGDNAQSLNVTPGVAPVLRSYSSDMTLAMRNGQTAQFAAATDPLTGDVVRVDVTLTVPK